MAVELFNGIDVQLLHLGQYVVLYDPHGTLAYTLVLRMADAGRADGNAVVVGEIAVSPIQDGFLGGPSASLRDCRLAVVGNENDGDPAKELKAMHALGKP